jgi:hypothetical protein
MGEIPGRYRADLQSTFAVVIGLLLVLSSIYLLGLYPHGSTSAGRTGSLGEMPQGFVYVEETVLDESGHTQEGTSSEIDMELGPDVVGLKVTLSWVDDIGSNDQFSLALKRDGGEISSISGTSGTLEISTNQTVAGNYTVVVTAVDCPGLFLRLPIDRDNGNDWSLTAAAIHAEPKEVDG